MGSRWSQSSLRRNRDDLRVKEAVVLHLRTGHGRRDVVVTAVAEGELVGDEEMVHSRPTAHICQPAVASCYLQAGFSSAEGLVTGSVMNDGPMGRGFGAPVVLKC
jgi:hypothetical protein